MEVMENHLISWQDNTVLQKKYDLFVKNLKKIEDAVQVLEKETAPLKAKRVESRKQLVEELFPVISVMGVFAYDTRDKKLGKLVNLKFSELDKMKPESLDRYSQKVLKRSGQLLSQKKEGSKKSPDRLISEYGLSSEHVEKLQKARDHALADDREVKKLRGDKERSTRILGKTMKENERLLKRNMDRMIPLFRDSKPAFYGAYLTARTTGGEGAEKTKGSGTATEKTIPAEPAASGKVPDASKEIPSGTKKTPASKTPVAGKKPPPAGKKPPPAGKKPPAAGKTPVRRAEGSSAESK